MKRLILCSDGSWDCPPRDKSGNVARLTQAIACEGKDRKPQIVFYQHNPQWPATDSWSLASSALPLLDNDILDCYRFVMHNYCPGDELWFFGYSRGAYVVRSCVELLRSLWLLPRQRQDLLTEAYRIYRTRWGRDAINASTFRTRYCQPVNIKFLGLWDTAGSHGLPDGMVSAEQYPLYRLQDDYLSDNIEHACQALAIDERRQSFTPTLWRTHTDRIHTEQCWFAGSHGDLGGGYSDDGLAMKSFLWMAGRARAVGLTLDESVLAELTASTGDDVVHDTFRRAGKQVSHRRALCATNHDETLHTSAEQRFLQQARYKPANLRDYLARDEQIQLPI